jgi:2-polyprenyl-3-methyl-5-hydroxy-6-metoxy-1,4-benzoquinol methylase
MKQAPQYWWGDPLDVRFYICEQLAKEHNKAILDIGCNVGIIVAAADKTNERIGVDIDQKAIAIAKKINKQVTFIDGDVFKTTLPKAHFDVVVLAHVLPKYDYVSSYAPKKFIERAASYLKPGGKLIVTSPNGDNSYFKKKKKIRYNELVGLFSKKKFSVEISGWNPFPIAAGHVLQYVPGWYKLIRLLMKKNVLVKRSVAFYVEATKR